MRQTIIFHAPKPKPRLKLLQRADAGQLPPLQLNSRDLAIIEAVYSFRALTTPQIEALLFPGDCDGFQPQAKAPRSGKTNRCRHRLKLLFHHGYLYREELPVPLTYGRNRWFTSWTSGGKTALCD